MSYSIYITHGEYDHHSSDDTLPVADLIRAFDDFGPFRKAGATWHNRQWEDLPGWQGLCVFPTEHAPAELEDGSFDYYGGEMMVLQLCMSLQSKGDMERCCDLAAHLARRLGAHAWDPQTGCDLAADE